jgi:DNA-binding winged helix-turn-helix (wHTH) protein/TolB-like protein/Tfp pilus assembly protein PilF
MNESTDATEKFYEFGSFRLLPSERLLLCDNQPVQLPPKVFDTLVALVERGGHLIEKDFLLDTIWADAFVEEATLARNISILRKVLGESGEGGKYIETVPKRGYRFTESVVERHSIYEAKPTAAPPKIRRPVLWLTMVSVVAIGIFASLSFWNAENLHPARVKSIAVLPFKALNPEADNQYIGLGIADSIIAKTSRIDGLTVRPTSAVRRYLNMEIDSLEAAREQKVDAVLDGTIQQSGEHLRVSVNLLSTSDGASLWAETFDLNFSDIFKMQDEVSRQVAARLRLKFGEAEAVRRDSANPEAYKYFAKAMYHFNAFPNTRAEADSAIDLLKKAIELDPDYVLAHARLGYTYTRIAVFLEENPVWIELAKQELATAERLDPQLAEVHEARYFMTFSQYEGWQIETAFREARLAQELDPNAAHLELGDLYCHIGLEDRGVEEYETALRIDPNSDFTEEAYIISLYQSNHPDFALELSKRFYNRGPNSQYYLEKMMAKEAAPLIAQQLQKNPVPEFVRIEQIQLLALQGKHDEAQAAVSNFLEKVRKNRGYHHFTYYAARIFAQGGKSAEALKWLRYTSENGFPCYPLFERDPYLNPIRKDPEFIKFLGEIKERWEGYRGEFG